MPMSAHGARPAHEPSSIFILTVVLVIPLGAMSFGISDIDILLKFKESLLDKSALDNWNPNINPCSWNYANWNGVLCLNGSIWGLKLEQMGLKGSIDVDSLASLDSLRSLSVMNNKFEGPLPDLKKLGSLKSLYLSNNAFSGTIPDDAFAGMAMLKKVYMANNMLTGNIPSSLAALPKLLELRLEANQFQGNIPDFKQQDGLKMLSLANNQLEGQIPAGLSRMDPTSFAGNKNLCGQPLDPCQQPSTPKNDSQSAEGQQALESHKKVSVTKVAMIVMLVGLFLGIIVAASLISYFKTHKSQVNRAPSLEDSNMLPDSYEHQSASKIPERVETKKKFDCGKLSFVRDDTQKFDLQDLLKSSAEVLGSGTFCASYKTGVYGQMLVVKRHKQMNKIGRDDFHEHMRRIGRLNHPNLLPLTAFYYRKEEKLLVYEFVENGSLASKLHVNYRTDHPGLDWPTRLKIIKGVVKGLAYLHSQFHSPILPYGHLKSSNVLLCKSLDPLLTDYALRPVINPDCAHMLMVAYKSPEYAKTGRISKRSDVWSLGILILEVLTGKFPENYLLQCYDSNASLSTWVNNMVKEKRLSEVFDKEMRGAKHSKSEMINLLKIGLNCCGEDPETRMSLKEVVEKIEELKEVNNGDDDQENAGEGYSFTSNVKPEDESSFLMHG